MSFPTTAATAKGAGWMYLVMAVVACGGNDQEPRPSYTLKDLGAIVGVGDSVQAAGLNDKGWVTGRYYGRTGGVRSFVFDGTSKKDLPLFDGIVVARQLNNNGWVTGHVLPNGAFEMEAYRAFVYDGTTITELGPIIGAGSEGLDINDGGAITGTANIRTDELGFVRQANAFVYDGIRSKDLGNLGGNYTAGSAINSAGWVTGSASINKTLDGRSVGHAFLYNGTTIKDLGALGGYGSFGSAINDKGWVAGSSYADDNVSYAFLYDGTTMKALGMPDYKWGRAEGINAAGDVVGQYATPESWHAFVYVGGTMYDLNDLSVAGASGWVLNQAIAINAVGQILGAGLVDGQTRNFLLTPTPAP